MRRDSFLTAILLCAFISSGITLAAENAQGYPRTIIDSAGREVTITIPVERIIVANADAAEAVTLLGASEKIVGVSDSVVTTNSEYLPHLKGITNIGKSSDYNYEIIGEISQKNNTIIPNIIVLCYANSATPVSNANKLSDNLARFNNLTVVGLDLFFPDNMTDEMAKLGVILDKEAEAQDYINWYAEQNSKIKGAVKDLVRPKVYFESSSKDGLGALGTNGGRSYINQLIKSAGGNNIAGSINLSYPKVEWEWVVKESPDIIIRQERSPTIGWNAGPSMDTVSLEKIKSEIANRPGAMNIPAVKNDKIFVVYYNMNAGLDCVIGQAYLAKLFHPEADLNPTKMYTEYLKRIGLDMPANRIFVYPWHEEQDLKAS